MNSWRNAATVLVILLCGCGTSPPTRFFAIEAVAPQRPPITLTGPPIVLNGVRLPAIYDRKELVRHGPGDSIQVSDTERWAAPLDEMVERVLGEELASRFPTGQFFVPALPKPPPPRRDLVVALQEFDLNAAGGPVLIGEWTLLAGSPARPVLQRRETIELPPASVTQAQAMSRALGELADRIAETIGNADAAGQKR